VILDGISKPVWSGGGDIEHPKKRRLWNSLFHLEAKNGE
jgi:hypothetical protein